MVETPSFPQPVVAQSLVSIALSIPSGEPPDGTGPLFQAGFFNVKQSRGYLTPQSFHWDQC